MTSFANINFTHEQENVGSLVFTENQYLVSFSPIVKFHSNAQKERTYTHITS